MALTSSPDGNSLASLESSGTIRLWGLQTFKEIRQYPGNRSGTKAIAFSHDGKQIATLGKNDNLVLLDTQIGAEEIWPDSPITKFLDLAFSLDGSLLAGREDTGKVRVWRTVDKKRHPLDGKVAVATSHRGRGIGSTLVDAAVDAARATGALEIWLVTTNDNVDALRLYQRRGFELTELRTGAVDRARLRKPTIPSTGEYGIPLRDELVLTRRLVS